MNPRYKKYIAEESNINIQNIDKIEELDNLIIQGDNLLVLQQLVKRYANKVKLIYIDPPYNTGNSSFLYKDKMPRSEWLKHIQERLKLAKTLLTDDGFIFVQCDDNEQAYLKVMMDEWFHYKETIVVKTSTPSGVNAINVKRGEHLFKLKEYILCYGKHSNNICRFNPMFIKSKYNHNYCYELIKDEHGFEIKNLKKTMNKEELEQYCLTNPDNIYSIETNNQKASNKLKEELEQSKFSNQLSEYATKDGRTLLYNGGVLTSLKERIVQQNGKNYFGVLIGDLWDDEVFQTNSYEGGVSFKNGKKPEKLLERIIQLTTNKNDLVLDFYLGSGTTIVATLAHKLQRRFIGVEIMDHQINLCLERMKRVISGLERLSEKLSISNNINSDNTPHNHSFVFIDFHNEVENDLT